MIKGDGALTEIPPFEAKWYEQKSIEILQPVCQDENDANAYLPT